MQEMSPSHYELFQDYVGRGMFDNQGIGSYLRSISSRAKHLVSPIKSDETVHAFGGMQELRKSSIAFMKRALAHGKVIPLEDLVCVEDDTSVVFVENNPQRERTLQLTVFRDIRDTKHPSDATIITGTLRLLEYNQRGNLFNVVVTYGAFIQNGSSDPIGANLEPGAKKDLVTNTNTVIEQLAYMEREELLADIKKTL